MGMVAFILCAVGAVWTFIVMAHDHQGAAVLFLLFAWLTWKAANINALSERWRGRA